MQTNPWPNIVAVATLATALIACSESADTPHQQHEPDSNQSSKSTPPPPRQDLPRVLDSYLVGEQVYVRSLAVDVTNSSLWVGTSVGVLEIDLATQAMRNTFTRKDGLANEYVFAIHVDRHGYKWFGTNAGGVARYRKGQWQIYFPMHGLADYWVYAFAEHPHGPLWIGTWAGVNRVELDTVQFSTYVKQLINEWVYAIAIDSRNRVWFGTEGGITMFDGKTWRHWTHEDGLGAPNGANKPSSPNTGLGTRSRHDLSVTVEGRDSYNPNYIFALLVDPSDNVWAGTWGGGGRAFRRSSLAQLYPRGRSRGRHCVQHGA